VAIPWPTPLENLLVQRLMQGIAAFAVEVLNWFGIAAQQQGNLIQLTGGSLGVDEACSGVRSFQATLMVSLFIGELNRLSVRKRLLLALLGAIVAVTFNLIRALTLAVTAGRHGIGAIECWHDWAGYIVLALSFFTLLIIAKLLRDQRQNISNAPADFAIHFPARAALLLLVWLGLSEVVNAAWYRAHEINALSQQRWTADWPFAPAPISENIRLLLRYNEGKSALWNRADGSQWQLFFFHWKPGRAAANLARNHRPETCLPATGFALTQNRGVTNYSANGISLPIERLEFASGGQSLHVYFCLWEDRTSPDAEGPQLLTRENRLRAVMEGRRHLGQRVLEVVIAGIESPQKADEEFAAELPKWIKMER
jgi:exosortase/archaeosortase family protein